MGGWVEIDNPAEGRARRHQNRFRRVKVVPAPAGQRQLERAISSKEVLAVWGGPATLRTRRPQRKVLRWQVAPVPVLFIVGYPDKGLISQPTDVVHQFFVRVVEFKVMLNLASVFLEI